MPRKTGQFRPKNAAPGPDCTQLATKREGTYGRSGKSLSSAKFGVHLANLGLWHASRQAGL